MSIKERQFITELQQLFSSDCENLEQGIGDDCAVVASSQGQHQLISTDMLVEQSHFDLTYHPPFYLGRKCVAVNLSDIAAMGGIPRFLLISIGISPKIDGAWLAEWKKGVCSIANEYGCTVIGGDTVSSDKLVFNITVIGYVKPDKVVYRSGAQVDQDIYVSGKLGSSAAGLALLKQGSTIIQEYNDLVLAHLDPIPQVKIGEALTANGLISSMQDISDGLSTDISHICSASNVGALVYENALPYTSSLEQMCRACSYHMLDFILFGGEDYQLVFTADPHHHNVLFRLAEKMGTAFHKVGKITKDRGVFLKKSNGLLEDIQFKGYEHIF